MDVADYMTRTARLTHVTAYLWLVKHAPKVWESVDRYQKRQEHTSPEWYYRRGCRRLFELARSLKPSADRQYSYTAISIRQPGAAAASATIRR